MPNNLKNGTMMSLSKKKKYQEIDLVKAIHIFIGTKYYLIFLNTIDFQIFNKKHYLIFSSSFKAQNVI